MGLYANEGIVFTAATVDWARVLASGEELNVEIITKNVLNRLKSRAVRVVGPLPTLCGSYIAVEGQKANFHVDTGGLPNQNNLHFEWSISNGNGSSSDQPTFEAVMPSPPQPVTVTVAVTDGTECGAFGTLTFVPLSTQEALRLELLCQLRTIVILIMGSRKAVEGVREGDRFFVDPLWDPLRYLLRPIFNAQDLRRMLQGEKRLVQLTERLIEMQQKR